MIRLGIVDDHPVFRLGLMRALEREPDLAVKWELGALSDLFETLTAIPVDVVLMDLNLGPDQDALAAIQAIRDRHTGVKVIVISSSLEWEAGAAARNAGASGYLPKDLSIGDMAAAIRGLGSHDFGRLEFSDLLASRPGATGSWATRRGLTRREAEVLGHLRRGHTNREIASLLNISVPTVNKHVQQVLKKLHVSNRSQAVALVHSETAGRIYESTGRRRTLPEVS